MEQLDMFEVLYDKLPTRNNIKLGTFFSGIGAPEMALTELSKEFDFNYESMFYSEIDKYAIKGYCAIHNQKEDDCLGSITDIKGTDLPYCDLWFGGFPCQDISLAGKGKGFSLESESRSSLGWEMIRLLREVKEKPMYVVFENVAAIFNNTHRPILNIFKRDLEELGYTLYNDLLNAKDYGIPQNRNRYFLLAILGKYNYKFPKPIKLELRLKDMLEDEVDEKYYLSDKMMKYIYSADGDNKKNGSGTYQVSKNSLQIDRNGAVSVTTREGNTIADSSNYISTQQLNNPKHSNERVYGVNGVSPTLNTMQGGNRQPFIQIPEATKKGYAIAKDGDGVDVSYPDSETRRGRVQEEMSGTIQCNDNLGVVTKVIGSKQKNAFIGDGSITSSLTSAMGSGGGHTPMVEFDHLRIRKLTPKECYRLMGFSDEAFERAAKVISNSQLYKTAGNSIVVDVLKAIFMNLFMLVSERKLLE
jgi:DNA (cytosine-5)-methyltransferase 1